MLVDACEAEEKVMEGLFAVGMNQHKELSTLTMLGEISLNRDQVSDLLSSIQRLIPMNLGSKLYRIGASSGVGYHQTDARCLGTATGETTAVRPGDQSSMREALVKFEKISLLLMNKNQKNS